MSVQSILIVDDEINQQIMLERALYSCNPGWIISTASNGHKALESIAQRVPSLIITDYHMPMMNGLELIAYTRAYGVCCPVIMITAYMSPELIEAATQATVAYCLTKPVPLAQIRRIVIAALNA